MTKFYTGKGDEGASIMAGKKIDKDDLFFYLLGGLDELNSWLGFCRATAAKVTKLKEVVGYLRDIQETLFIAQAEVAAVGSGVASKIKVSSDKTKDLERIIARVDKVLPPLAKFIIPGASELSASLDVARVMARQVERLAKTFSKKKKLRPEFLQYLNRLSSVLFALARFMNFKLKVKEEHPSYK